MGSVDIRRASGAPRPLREGFLDISMYVAPDWPSKNDACMHPDNLRRIFRKLRLAVFGLVEVGVGLLPGGGGCKEMLLRAVDSAAAIRKDGRSESVELMEAMKKTFETIATAKVATSAYEARGLGFLSDADRITMNRERVLSDAKARALELAQTGYQPPAPRTDIPAPGESILAALKMGVHLMRQGEFISDHEVKIGAKVAEVLCAGNLTPGTPVSEQYILDLEREAFKSLCGERKTQERIQYTLKTGKTLRN